MTISPRKNPYPSRHRGTGPTGSPHHLGRSGEEHARAYLQRKGFRILETGYRLGRGEIDIVAAERDTLVFVEVKTRLGSSPQAPEEAVTPAKQRQIRRLAEGYLHKRRIRNVKCRFDVLALRFDAASGFSVDHYRDAFD